MIIEVLVLVLSFALWLSVLWLAIAPNFLQWSTPALIALHLWPLGAWMFWVVLRRRAIRRERENAQRREAEAQAARDAARIAAKQKYDEEMQQRRFGCDCRFVAITSTASSDLPLVSADVQGVELQMRANEAAQQNDNSSLLDRLLPAMAEVLKAIYTTSEAAALFPIYVLPPSELSGEDVISRTRTLHADLIRELSPSGKFDQSPLRVLFLPSGDSVFNSAVSLFESTPDLPGAIVLALDSPISRTNPHDDFSDDDPNTERSQREKYLGMPGEGVIALLLTHPALSSMLSAVAYHSGELSEQESMTPFWQKEIPPNGNLALLTRVNAACRDELLQLPVLGRVHRASFGQSSVQHAGVLEMTKLAQSLLERAQINAGLIKPPFSHEDTGSESDTAQLNKEEKPASLEEPLVCSRLVHNAGNVDVAGKRLAALGSAMYHFNIDLNPVDTTMATNMVTRIGNLGKATSLGQLAIGVTHAAESKAAVMCAEFFDENGVAISFVTPGSIHS